MNIQVTLELQSLMFSGQHTHRPDQCSVVLKGTSALGYNTAEASVCQNVTTTSCHNTAHASMCPNVQLHLATIQHRPPVCVQMQNYIRPQCSTDMFVSICTTTVSHNTSQACVCPNAQLLQTTIEQRPVCVQMLQVHQATRQHKRPECVQASPNHRQECITCLLGTTGNSPRASCRG